MHDDSAKGIGRRQTLLRHSGGMWPGRTEPCFGERVIVSCKHFTLMMFVVLIQTGICMGVQPVTAYNYGAHNLP